MSIAVFDASVAVKWFVRDALTPEAERARSAFEPTAPALIQIEVANALWKYARLKVISAEHVVEGVATLSEIMKLMDDRGLLGSAQRLASRIDHPVYDCLYLSLAQTLAAPLVTADRRLADKSGGLGITTHLIKTTT